MAEKKKITIGKDTSSKDAKTEKKSAPAAGSKAASTGKGSAAGSRSASSDKKSSSKEEKSAMEKNIEELRAASAKRKEVWDEVILVIAGLVGILLYLSFFGKCGIVGKGINTVLFGLLGGVIPYIFPIAMFVLVFYIRKYPDDPLAVRRTTVFLLELFVIAGLVHLFSGVCSKYKFFESFKVGYDQKIGGGLFGACIAKPLNRLFGSIAAVIILIAFLLVCIILMLGHGVFKAIKEYIEERRKEKEIANDPQFADTPAGVAPPAGSQTFTLEDIQEENRKRRVMLVDAEPPSTPVDLSFYGEPKKPVVKKKQGFLDKLLGREPEPEPVPQRPTYTAVYGDDGTVRSRMATASEIAAIPQVDNDAVAPMPKETRKEIERRNREARIPDQPSGTRTVTESGHPFYQIELDTKFRETTSPTGGSIIKNDYGEGSPATPAISEREAARRRAVADKLDTVSDSARKAVDPEIPIHGLNPAADTARQSHADSGYNPYDAVETGEAVAPSKEELASGGLKPAPAANGIPASGTAAAGTQSTGGTTAPKASAEGTEGDAAIPSAEEVPVPEYIFPPIELLNRPSSRSGGMTEAQLKATAAKLQQTLQSFGVNVTVTNISCGPSVTRYELSPEQGVKVSKITNLENDIKLNLAAEDIRIEAPIPGKAAVGIEVPNTEASGVMLRTLIDSQEFKTNKGKISFAVGKDIGGNIVISDIAKMPHLLIAGATGSGKSVCINTMVISLLYKYKPEDLRIIMIDPKVVELSVYNGIPHLLIPVVTDPRKASNALNWAVKEMTDRYERFAQLGVRNLEGYNEKIAAAKEPYVDDKGNVLRKMAQIVIIVDELADLMMVAPGEVEDAICRLAQLARAAGLHLVIATQRPSVDVITGLIKANIPSRIAFAVSSGIDSRTILDQVGAEKLLGKGDMLFFPQGIPKPVRLQGPFVSDEEIQKIVDFLTEDSVANYDMTAAENIQNGDVASVSEQMKNGGDSAPDDGRDEYFAQAGRFIIEKEKASIGMLQRVYKIGFNRAARIMDQLAEAGVVGPEEGTKPRKILMNATEFEQFLQNK